MNDRKEILFLLHTECFPGTTLQLLTKSFEDLTTEDLLEVFTKEMA